MSTKRKRNKIKIGSYVTLPGVAKYPHLNKPDTKWKAEGEYKVDLIYTAEQADAFRDKLQALLDKGYAELVKEHFADAPAKARKVKKGDLPLKAEEDEEGEETGRFVLATKRTASGTRKSGETWTAKIAIHDSSGKKLAAPPAIWGGSKLRVDCDVAAWYSPKDNVVGLKLEIVGVQIIELVSGGGDRASGFGEVEGGYTSDDSDRSSGFGDSDDGDDAADDDSSPDF